MAYLRKLAPKCDRAGCDKRATVEVVSCWNDSVGKYCAKCGKYVLKRRTSVKKGKDK